MNRLGHPLGRIFRVLFSLSALVGTTLGTSRAADVDSQTFWPAFWRQGSSKLRLFPETGPEIAFPLPEAANRFASISFSPDGRSFYGFPLQGPGLPPSALTRIAFKPSTESVVAGSKELLIGSLTISPSGKMLVAGWLMKNSTPEKCGYFEIDSPGASARTLRIGCRERSGPISPDGKEAAIVSNKQLSLLNLETAAVRVIKAASGTSGCTWSPDSRSLACRRDGKILIVDVDTLRLKEIDAAGNFPAEWSPDGKSLLVLRSQLSCLPNLYGQSLEVIDIKSGRGSWLKSAHCNVIAGYYGWVDRDIAR